MHQTLPFRLANVARRAACSMAICSAFFIGAMSGLAQPQKPRAARGQTVELSEDRFHLDEVGLTIQFPVGAIAQTAKIGERRSVQIVPESEDWVVNIQTPVDTSGKSSITEAADNTLALLQGAYGVTDPDQKLILETKVKILDRTSNLKVTGGAECERLYVSVPRPDGSSLVKGYSIFKPSGNQFVVFELITAEEKFPAVRPLYEASVATAQFLDTTSLNVSRGSLVKAGDTFFAGLAAQDYERVLTGKDEIVHRLALPARTGSAGDAMELGFRTMRFWKGQRSEIGGTTGRRAGQDEGYLARIQARLLHGDNVIDSEGVYFMTPDRAEEAWVLRTVVWGKNGEQVAKATETGARFGTDLSVSISDSGQATEDVRPFVPAEGYISQFELFLLHRLMISKEIRAELGTYAYQSQSKTVSLRRDLLSPAKSGGAKAVWEVQTTYRDDATPVSFLYDATGNLVRSSLEDGSVWETTDRESLLSLWRRKGLPTGAVGNRR